MKNGLHICLYKKKGNPIILAYVQDNEARISMPLDEFLTEVVKELGSVTWVIKDDTFKTRLADAVVKVIRGIKEGATVIV